MSCVSVSVQLSVLNSILHVVSNCVGMSVADILLCVQFNNAIQSCIIRMHIYLHTCTYAHLNLYLTYMLTFLWKTLPNPALFKELLPAVHG